MSSEDEVADVDDGERVSGWIGGVVAGLTGDHHFSMSVPNS